MGENTRSLIISFLLAGLFLVAMVSFGVSFANENDLNMSIAQHSTVNDTYFNINDSLGDSRVSASGQRNATTGEVVTGESSESVITGGSIWGSIKTFSSGVLVTANMILQLPYILGISAVVVGVFITIVTILIIFLGWKTLRSGD